MVAQAGERSRAQLELVESGRESRHRLAVADRRAEEHASPVIVGEVALVVAQRPSLCFVASDDPLIREPGDQLEHLGSLELGEHLLAVTDCLDVVQREVKQRLEAISSPRRDDRGHHSIEVEVLKARGLLGAGGRLVGVDSVEQQTAECHRLRAPIRLR